MINPNRQKKTHKKKFVIKEKTNFPHTDKPTFMASNNANLNFKSTWMTTLLYFHNHQ